MREILDSELFSFSAQILEKNGAVIEQQPGHLLALLPDPLARILEIPEEAQLGGDGVPLLYGSPLLDRLIHLATRQVPIVYGQVEVPYLKKAGFDQIIGQDLSFADGQVRVVSRAEARTRYLVLACHYIALSDERKEGLAQVTVNEESGAFLPDFKEGLPEFQLQFFKAGEMPASFPRHLEPALSSALRNARNLVEGELSEFLASMRRRLRRDARNTREYYEALRAEMEASLARPNITDNQREERITKIRELPLEMARKIADLQHKYQIQVTLAGAAATRLLLPVVQLSLQIYYRKLQGTAQATWNPVTRRLDPMVCKLCQKSIRRIYHRQMGAQILCLCSSCASENRP